MPATTATGEDITDGGVASRRVLSTSFSARNKSPLRSNVLRFLEARSRVEGTPSRIVMRRWLASSRRISSKNEA